MTHAYKNVPYYRKLFDREGLKPDDIQTIDDLSKIPITSKKDLQLLPVEEVVARGVNPKNLIVRRTSGSTGEPFTIRRTWFEERLLGALRLRARHSLGLRTTDRTASIGLVRPTQHSDNQILMRIVQAFGLYNKVEISCLLPPEDIIGKLELFHPHVLSGFPGVISRLAQIVSDEGRLLFSPRFITVGAEVLTPLMRTQITKAFSAPVFDTYGSHEFNLIAWECKETGEFHTCDDGMIVEVLKHGRPAAIGERGVVVGTNLHSFAMPFIRYRLGDIVTKGSETCQCGQPFSTIRTIQGRMIDYFPLPEGRLVHPYEITQILKRDADSWIQQHQLIQEREDRIILQVVPSPTPTPQEILKVETSVSSVLGQGVEFQVMLVSEIKTDQIGKFRVSRSLVKSPYDGIEWEL
jgi:phenylacetate-CoA ligase